MLTATFIISLIVALVALVGIGLVIYFWNKSEKEVNVKVTITSNGAVASGSASETPAPAPEAPEVPAPAPAPAPEAPAPAPAPAPEAPAPAPAPVDTNKIAAEVLAKIREQQEVEEAEAKAEAEAKKKAMIEELATSSEARYTRIDAIVAAARAAGRFDLLEGEQSEKDVLDRANDAYVCFVKAAQAYNKRSVAIKGDRALDAAKAEYARKKAIVKAMAATVGVREDEAEKAESEKLLDFAMEIEEFESVKNANANVDTSIGDYKAARAEARRFGEEVLLPLIEKVGADNKSIEPMKVAMDDAKAAYDEAVKALRAFYA